MKKQKAMFTVDPNDYNGLLEIMKNYGDSEFPFSGKNEKGEETETHVCSDSITVITYQKNGWIRRNVYTNSDGDIISEELFDGKYEKPIGRPKADNPKGIKYSVRTDEETENKLLQYCEAEGITKGEAYRRGIELLLKQANM